MFRPIPANIVYFYDLPPHEVTSTQLARKIREVINVHITEKPQIYRDPNKIFWSAVVKFDDTASFELACKAFRYFMYKGDDASVPARPIRALPFMTELKGENLLKNISQNVFVKNLPTENFTSKELEEHFSKFGEIVSCKVSINSDYTSRGYGMVYFRDQASV